MSDHVTTLNALGLTSLNGDLESFSPIDGQSLGKAQQHKLSDVDIIADLG